MGVNPGQAKVCVICGTDCSDRPRIKDSAGRYSCKTCYDQALKRRTAGAHAPQAKQSAAHANAQAAPARRVVADANDNRGAYGLEEHGLSSSGTTRPRRIEAPASAPNTAPPAPICPSCDRPLERNALICVPCGIHVHTGRSYVTAEAGDTERVYEHARGILWFVSWVLWLGLLPISSEAHGARRPHALRVIAGLTVFFTMWMWWYQWTGSPRMQVLKNQMHWVGGATPDAERIEMFYEFTDFGDHKAYQAKKAELAGSIPAAELPLAALNALPARQRCFGEFHLWQLVTHAFLHADILHLAGNMLFLLIFGSRINALIGSVGVFVLYPILAIFSAIVDMVALAHEMPAPSLGASGAIMGLAGMYLMLFPVSPVHVAFFVRVPVLLLLIFKCRGFWILLYFIAWDVLYTLLKIDTGTAHWAHMGGFAAGLALGFVLLVTRGVNARGNDLLSALNGRHAWAILGRPSQWQHISEGEGWLTRARLVPRDLWEDVLETFRLRRQA